jgi:hypothetical protein
MQFLLLGDKFVSGPPLVSQYLSEPKRKLCSTWRMHIGIEGNIRRREA